MPHCLKTMRACAAMLKGIRQCADRALTLTCRHAQRGIRISSPHEPSPSLGLSTGSTVVTHRQVTLLMGDQRVIRLQHRHGPSCAGPIPNVLLPCCSLCPHVQNCLLLLPAQLHALLHIMSTPHSASTRSKTWRSSLISQLNVRSPVRDSAGARQTEASSPCQLVLAACRCVLTVWCLAYHAIHGAQASFDVWPSPARDA